MRVIINVRYFIFIFFGSHGLISVRLNKASLLTVILVVSTLLGCERFYSNKGAEDIITQ